MPDCDYVVNSEDFHTFSETNPNGAASPSIGFGFHPDSIEKANAFGRAVCLAIEFIKSRFETIALFLGRYSQHTIFLKSFFLQGFT
jgi:hypothetical protein